MQKKFILTNWLWHFKCRLISWLGGQSLGARALVIKEDEILLVKHTYNKGWYTIGGGTEEGESPIDTISRELQEEVGVFVEGVPELFGFYLNTFQKRNDYVVLYLVKYFTQKPVSCAEIEASAWFKLNKLPDDISPATKRRIEEYLGLQPISDKW